jgi:SAM-dependent methyltransferase
MSILVSDEPLGTEANVYERYASAANAVEPALCCPIQYNTELLKAIPPEVIEKDYGCGDPSPYVRPNDVVLDLGSGGGKLCFIASQLVGPSGRVIGVDCNREMLALARRNAPLVAHNIGYSNVEFKYGMIQDLQLDLERMEDHLNEQPVQSAADYLHLRSVEERLRKNSPLIESDSVDCVVSNCVLNLVRQSDRQRLFAEIYRVLRDGGRAAISDIVSDEDVPVELQRDPTLWSGCLSGAFREDEFLKAFEAAGFYGISITRWSKEPWQTIQGIEFRSVTVVAYKGKDGPCLERNQSVVYRGPFKKVQDDDGHLYYRGERMAVCDKTFRILSSPPYADAFECISPVKSVPLEEASPFPCQGNTRRHPRESKGLEYDKTDTGPNCSSDVNPPCC